MPLHEKFEWIYENKCKIWTSITLKVASDIFDC
jgi:hypothetical protein